MGEGWARTSTLPSYSGIYGLCRKLDEIEEEIQNLEEEEPSEGELAELERLSRETMENGVPWEEAKKRLGL